MPPRPPRPPVREKSRDLKERVVGVGAARATLLVRPGDVLHIAHCAEARKAVGELLREAARLRIAYREVPREELERMAGTLHHEGVCLEVKRRAAITLDDVLSRMREGGFAVALDQVENPHNVGALLRTAAYFGARALVVHSPERGALTPSAVRIAEGGAEYVPVCFVPNLAQALLRLQEAGAEVVGADAHAGESVLSAKLANKTVLVMGSERHGLSPEVQRRCQRRVRIEGTQNVESLNVSVAAGILMAQAAHASTRTP